MFLHIGNGENVRKSEVIGIFDLDTATVSKVTQKYINKNEKEGNIDYSDSDLPRSFILIEKNKKYKIKLSRISSSGLIARFENKEIIDFI
jgi:predicted transcriptional regulator